MTKVFEWENDPGYSWCPTIYHNGYALVAYEEDGMAEVQVFDEECEDSLEYGEPVYWLKGYLSLESAKAAAECFTRFLNR